MISPWQSQRLKLSSEINFRKKTWKVDQLKNENWVKCFMKMDRKILIVTNLHIEMPKNFKNNVQNMKFQNKKKFFREKDWFRIEKSSWKYDVWILNKLICYYLTNFFVKFSKFLWLYVTKFIDQKLKIMKIISIVDTNHVCNTWSKSAFVNLSRRIAKCLNMAIFVEIYLGCQYWIFFGVRIWCRLASGNGSVKLVWVFW